MLYDSHAKVVNRRHRGAMCSVRVGRAVRCACVAPDPTHFFAGRSRLQQKNIAQNARVSMLQYGGVIDVASAPGQPSAA